METSMTGEALVLPALVLSGVLGDFANLVLGFHLKWCLGASELTGVSSTFGFVIDNGE